MKTSSESERVRALTRKNIARAAFVGQCAAFGLELSLWQRGICDAQADGVFSHSAARSRSFEARRWQKQAFLLFSDQIPGHAQVDVSEAAVGGCAQLRIRIRCRHFFAVACAGLTASNSKVISKRQVQSALTVQD